jgi:purine-binding chemotaxis protein CheW
VSGQVQAVVFRLDEQRYALHLAAVRRVIRAVHVTALPGAPDIVLGAVDVQGEVLPVLDLRARFGLPAREIRPSDQFLIASTARRVVALVIDEVHEVIERDAAAVTEAGRIGPDPGHVSGLLQLDDELVLIHDLERFLSLDEECTLDLAMERAG